MGMKREEKALREFKQIIEDLLFLLRRSAGAETAYLLWVNRAREQLVLEASTTSFSNVMFADRTAFQDHFLSKHLNTEVPIQLKVGEKIDKGQLEHYYSDVPIKQITAIPFVNNQETVAITVVETAAPFKLSEQGNVIQSYKNALGNVLNTYLELTDLHEKQQEWIDYEASLNTISTRLHKVEIIHRMLNEMQKLLPSGGACLVARGMETWVNVLCSKGSVMAPSLGLMIDEKSIAYDSLQNGKPEFAIHFNQNPKRLSTSELETEGATFAIPFMINDKRYGTVITYDRNPLVFKQSARHKLANLVRISALAIRANLDKVTMDEDLFTSEFNSFIPDIWEKALESVIEGDDKERRTWFGFIAIENLQTLRSKYRLEELRRLQRTLVKGLNPSRFGFNGYIGFNSDYVFSFLMQDTSDSAPANWIGRVNKMLSRPVSLSDGQQVDVQVTFGYTKVQGNEPDFHTVVQRAKANLSDAVKQSVSG